MAPKIRYTAISASLWATDSPFLELSAKAQWLYLRLWTSDSRNAAGFVPLQESLWAKSSTSTSPDTIEAALDELTATGWLLVDFDAQQVWLCRFIHDDTYNSPNQYVSVMSLIRTCPSWMLRDAAWKEVQRLGLPPVKSDKPEAREKMRRRMEAAFEALKERMYAAPRGGDRKGFERVSKLPNVNAHAHAGEGAGDRGTSPARVDAPREGMCTRCNGWIAARDAAGPGDNPAWCRGCNDEARADMAEGQP